ncbi:hypothetical protein JHK82_052859 [Glycine max]|nr:hypothetical protein JHK86_052711 [Glycine max]KAG5082702.1 hypothetical protein JHK84_052740 [Glycine max]KAG5085462.1 hypothetical protein JHK82_052859 [Glycine max]
MDQLVKENGSQSNPDGGLSVSDAVLLFISFLLEKSKVASTQKNKASVAALNAEVRRTKGRLMDELPKLRKLMHKKDLVLALLERIQAIPDGTSGAVVQTTGWTATSSQPHINFDLSKGHLASDYFLQSEESSQFRQEYEMRRMKRDEGLDIISEGLDTLKDLAHEMSECGKTMDQR